MSLIAWYPLNGTLEDYSGNKIVLQNNGSVVNTSGKIGSCYYFNNSYTTFNNVLLGTKIFSICFWMKQNSPGAWSDIFSTNSGLFRLEVTDNKSIYRMYGTGPIAEGTVVFDTISDGVWTHMTLVSDGNKWYSYINGNLNKSGNCVDKTITGDLMYLGARGSGGMNWNGYLNDIRIYDHSLSVKEIKEISRAKILHYKFDDPYEEPTTNLQNKFTLTTAEKGTDYFVKKETDQWHQGALLSNIPVTPGKTYTWSIDIKSDRKFDIRFDGNCTATNYTGNDGALSSTSFQTVNYDTPGKWKRVSFTTTIKSDAQNPYIHHSFCPPYISGVNLKVYVKNSQVEEKDHDTPFINGSRTGGIKDCSGFRNHGTCSTYPKWVNQSPSGTGSFEFNDNTIECKGSVLPTSSSQEWTVSCWVKFKSNPTTVQYLTNTNLGVRLHHSSTKALNYINHGTNDWYKYSAIISNPTDWFHFASTFNQQTDTIKIWINGVNRTDTGPNNSGGTKQTAGVSSIFKMFSGFIGYASDFRLYATELSDQDIKELYETKASVSKNNKLFVNEIVENKNYADIMNDAINKKQFVNGLTGYEQTHCKVTITDDGYRIYRTPNVNPSANGNVMWGGVKLQFPEGTFQKGRKYKLSVLVKGKTSNAIGVPYLTPQMGWTAGGLTSLNASSVINIPSNFNSDTYQYFEAVFDLINFEPCQTASKTESIFTQGKTYNCCRDLAWGFSYTDTGSLGTDLYFKDFSLTDITDLNNTKVNKKGQLETKEIIEFNFKPTLIDYSKWTIGTGSVGDWSQNGTNSENKRIVKTNPKGNLDIVWATEANDSTSDSDGGWNISGKSIDTTKKYRFTCWIKRENTGNGRTYFGCTASTVCNLGTTTVNTNPYFYNGLISDAPEMGETWCLFVAYIHPHDYTGTSDSTNGFYRGDTKARTRGCGDFKWSSTATTSGVRSYLYYSTSTEERQYWYRPRFEMCDGTEPSINTLLNCCEHLPLVNNKGVPISIDNFSINKDGSCKSNEFIEC